MQIEKYWQGKTKNKASYGSSVLYPAILRHAYCIVIHEVSPLYVIRGRYQTSDTMNQGHNPNHRLDPLLAYQQRSAKDTEGQGRPLHLKRPVPVFLQSSALQQLNRAK